ncbi:uncharacterized protein LOC124916019 [Impatiens glandulifera]|uniref:uncharacterized protein LOC124916019 n=1 Tax=Impatiens glandulifera TaxID=253017 RepID=UPI001FB10BFA|nr:uncharacterized protein LOC124916019 [Impatiens glandulifera]
MNGDNNKKLFRSPSTASATFEESGDPIAAMEVDDDGEAEAAEEADNELSRLLETYAGSEMNMTKVRFIEYPYSWPLIFRSSMTSSYITINGNEESCGSSFSDLDSSAMASIDVRPVNYISHGLFFEAFRTYSIDENEDGFFDIPVFSETDGEMLARFLWEEDVDD